MHITRKIVQVKNPQSYGISTFEFLEIEFVLDSSLG